MYKKIVSLIIAAENIAELDKAATEIDKAYQAEKITYKDNEQLYDLIAKVSGGYYHRANITHIKAK